MRKPLFSELIAFVLGMLIVLIPSIWKYEKLNALQKQLDQAQMASTEKLDALQKHLDQDQIAFKVNRQSAEYSTILISRFAEVPHRNWLGVEDPWSHLDLSLIEGTVWIVPGLMVPHTLMPDSRASYATVDPQGHVGTWFNVPAKYDLRGEFGGNDDRH